MKPTDSRSLRRHVFSSFRDGTYTNANVGMSESFFVAYMLALGFNEVWAGLSIILAQFLGVTGQILSLSRTLKVRSVKKRLLIFLPLQALAFIPLIIMGVVHKSHPALMIICLGFYWFNLLSLNPPWWKLMGHTIPKAYRLKFFAYRNLLCQLSVFLGLGASGLILHWAKSHGYELYAYIGIFLFGCLLKTLSWSEIRFIHIDHITGPNEEGHVTFKEFIQTLKGTEQGRLITFLAFFYITVHSSASYFNPYMLGPMGLNYLKFITVVGISYLGRVVGSRLIQKWARPSQMNQILFIVTLGISLNPLMWAISRNYNWILIIEFWSGLNWAGLELGTSLLFYQHIQDKDRTSLMSYISFVQISGMAIGCSIGAIFLEFAPNSWDKFLALFVFSSCFRLIGFVASPQFKYRKEMPQFWTNIRGPGRWFQNFFDKED